MGDTEFELVDRALVDWAAGKAVGRVERVDPISGGNRCEGWVLDIRGQDDELKKLFLRTRDPGDDRSDPYSVRREGEVYAALAGTGVPAPALVAVHPSREALLLERLQGRADYRHIATQAEKASIASEFIRALVRLHSLDVRGLFLPTLGRHQTISEAVRAELETWWSMYQANGRVDPLIEYAHVWLGVNLPQVEDRPVLVHGDAGPGNFMFAQGRLTGLIDWELAHLGDPMEDLAWLSMRSVMEPVPDFCALITEYERRLGKPIDRDRLLYHRVFVSFRVVVIRHRGLTGQPGASIVSRCLNKRLLVEAMAEAQGQPLRVDMPRLQVEPAEEPLFAAILDQLKDIAASEGGGRSAAVAKDIAKTVKYLRRLTASSDAIEQEDGRAVAELLGRVPDGNPDAAVLEHIRAHPQDSRLLRFFAAQAGRDAFLAADASGGLAERHFPPLPARFSNDFE